jgi:hypothetical protein
MMSKIINNTHHSKKKRLKKNQYKEEKYPHEKQEVHLEKR